MNSPSLLRLLKPRRPACLSSTRNFSTEFDFKPISRHSGPVELAYERYPEFPDDAHRGQPLVMLHGFLGSRRNWATLGRAMSRELGRPVYALDLRNHGSSPHVDSMKHLDMVGDVAHFLEKHSLRNVTLIGHSLGGQIAMALALGHTSDISRLVVIDGAPTQEELSPTVKGYVEGMHKVAESRVTTRKAATEIMIPYESDESIRYFLLANFRQGPGLNPLQSRMPMKVVKSAVPDIAMFPYTPQDADAHKWIGPTLAIKGVNSEYINDENIPLFTSFFPETKLEVLGGGHWVHTERAAEFKRVVAEFLTETS